MIENDRILDMISVLKNLLDDVQQLKVEIKEMQIELNRMCEVALIPYILEESEERNEWISKQVDVLFDCVY